ncbi:putative thiamine transporter SLC35F3 [Paramacrobiotus metropolitanus]|uniref:putative thiamine transporter SLC35F3 n=1 Tax=Paramacrobiotus metropolitanus TaxID=2943436 RepID=UPI0024459DB0|nr:putative thiamine transporter SLC35F3 [Paramacrobiotus metropolitanus]XP_055327831.1 putative thiamine transporter SLC35F3 [Paramacrobiotus metropolitanus]
MLIRAGRTILSSVLCQQRSQSESDEQQANAVGNGVHAHAAGSRMSIHSNSNGTPWRRISRVSSDDSGDDFKKPDPDCEEDSVRPDDKPPDEDLKRLRFKDFRLLVLGLLCIGGIAISSALLNYYAKNTSTTYFHAPLFLIWFRSNWRISAFPIFVVLRKVYDFLFKRCGVKQETVKDLVKNGTKIYGGRKISAKIFFIDIALLSTISIAVQYLTFAPYHFVWAGNGTALNASNVAWVYILSVIILGVDIMPVKILGVLCSLIGVVLLAYHEGFTNPDWESAVMMILGAMITAVYQVLYKKRIGGTTDLGQITFSVSTLACFTLFTMWPIVLILYLTKAERWEWESIPWDIVCKNSAASMAFNYLINLGVAWTNPVYTSLGFLLAVPLAHFFDASLAHKQFAPVETAGTVMIGMGFVVIVFADRVSFDCLQGLWARVKNGFGVAKLFNKKSQPDEGQQVMNAPDQTNAAPIPTISVQVDDPDHRDNRSAQKESQA